MTSSQSERKAVSPEPIEFDYSPWRHGGWYVNNVRYPSGAVGCVSRNFPDGKWRIVCDPRPFAEQPTFGTRDEAARAEYALATAAATAAAKEKRWRCVPQSMQPGTPVMAPEMRGCGQVWTDKSQPLICPECLNPQTRIEECRDTSSDPQGAEIECSDVEVVP